MVFWVKETFPETSDDPRAIFEPPRAAFFKFLSKFVQDMLIVMKDLSLKTKPKNFFLTKKFFSPKSFLIIIYVFKLDF